MINLKFRSIKVVNTEIPVNIPGRTMIEMNYDMNSVSEHRLVLGLKDIILDRPWIIYFFLTSMIVSALAALAYGFSALAYKIEWKNYSAPLISSGAILFLLLWAALSVPAVFKNKKEKMVRSARGDGNWRIVDEKKWDRFSRMLAISAKKSGPRV